MNNLPEESVLEKTLRKNATNRPEDIAKQLTEHQVALVLAENDKLRLKVKMLSIHLNASHEKDEVQVAFRGAIDYFQDGFESLYGITVRDGKLVYVDSGAELPRAGRIGDAPNKEPVQMEAVEMDQDEEDSPKVNSL